jgi:aminoacrylate hydrolase
LLHGVGGGAWSWKPQRAVLAERCAVFIWEGRGHGEAARVPDAGLADYWQDAVEALAAIRERGLQPVTVVGHSMGGLLALRLATEFPAAVAGVVLIDPVYAPDGSAGHVPGLLGSLAAAAFSPLFRSIAANGRVARTLSRWIFTNAFENRARLEAAWVDQRTQVPVEYPRMLREAFTGPTGIEIRDDASAVEAPTLVLEGSSGRKAPRFPGLVEALRRRLGPRFRYEAIAGGHYLQLDAPEAVNALLLQWIAPETGELLPA